jgi:hypothetical protein
MTQFGHRGETGNGAFARTHDAPTITAIAPPIGIGLCAALLGCGIWWIGDYLVTSFRVFYTPLYFAASIKLAIGAGIATRATLNRLLAQRFAASTLALLEAAACIVLLLMFLGSAHGLLATIQGGMFRFAFISGFAALLFVVLMVAPFGENADRKTA